MKKFYEVLYLLALLALFIASVITVKNGQDEKKCQTTVECKK